MTEIKNIVPAGKQSELPCPDCHEKMFPYTCVDRLVYLCHNCQGIWFDYRRIGDFKKVVDGLDLSRIVEFFDPPEAGRISISVCPRCELALDDFRYGYNSGVELRKCGSCQGLWSTLLQTLNIFKSAKISQEIAGDVRGFNQELKKIRKENKWIKAAIEVSKKGRGWDF